MKQHHKFFLTMLKKSERNTNWLENHVSQLHTKSGLYRNIALVS